MPSDVFAAFGIGCLVGFVIGVMVAAILSAIANKIDSEDYHE